MRIVALAGACTSILVGRLASDDGSLFASHSNDGGATTDPRLVRVPAQRHADKWRPVWPDTLSFPRFAGAGRGPIPAYALSASEGHAATRAVGRVRQVPATYGYLEDSYGALNEKQVGVGESTCSSVPWTKFGGKESPPCAAANATNCALLSITELTRLAMERANSSRAAVELMGAMAEEHGFYGEDGFEGTGESLMVVDPREGWVFHVLSHPNGRSALWAAQRVPDDHVAAVTNMFTIREVDLSDPARFLGSDLAGAVKDIPELYKTCPSNEKCDFTLTFSDGEYAHKYYSGRRMWGVYRLLAPGTALPSEYGDLKLDAPYPATVPVDALSTGHRVSLGLVMRAHRDHYEGTEFSLTDGLAAGPFGDPTRNAPSGTQLVDGNWERAISLQRTSDSYIVQARSFVPDALGTLWFGPQCPHATSYTPFASGMEALPPAFSAGHQGTLDKQTAFWRVRYVAQAMHLKFNYTRADVALAQQELLAESQARQVELADRAKAGGLAAAELTRVLAANAERMLARYERLFDELLFKYADGWVNEPELGTAVGYPGAWLKAVGYPDGPPPVPPPAPLVV